MNTKPGFWTRVKFWFSGAATIAGHAWDIAVEVLPDLVAAGCADPNMSDSERRVKVRHELAAIIAERYPRVPVGVLDVALGFALDFLRAQIKVRH